MRIFHGPHNIIGSPGLLARAQRDLGAEAYAYCYSTGSYQYPTDHVITHDKKQWVSLVTAQSLRHDCFQFYFGESLTGPHLLDVPWLKRLGKKVFFYFCGCDIRDCKATIAKYKYSACKNCWPMACSANRAQARETALRYADGIFVMTPDLLEFLPGSRFLPTPVDLARFERVRAEARSREPSPRTRIAHAPSNRKIKGTEFLERAVQVLQADGYPIELILVEKKSNEEAMEICARADIIVDQLLIGAYGQCSVEMMALGKPVVCYLREDLRGHYPSGLPIISANPDTIGTTLKDLFARRCDWAELGRQGIEYVAAVHDSRLIAARLLEVYRGGAFRAVA